MTRITKILFSENTWECYLNLFPNGDLLLCRQSSKNLFEIFKDFENSVLYVNVEKLKDFGILSYLGNEIVSNLTLYVPLTRYNKIMLELESSSSHSGILRN